MLVLGSSSFLKSKGSNPFFGICMLTLFVGYFLNKIFRNQIIEYFKVQFWSLTLSFYGFLFGWLFQQYIREEFELTAGKRFILDCGFRNQLLIQSFKIVRNFFFYFYSFLILDLVIFLLFFVSLGCIFKLINWLTKVITKNNVNHFCNKIFKIYIERIIRFNFRNNYFSFKNVILISLFSLFFKNIFLKVYFWLYSLVTIKLIIAFLFNFFSIALYNYLIYIIIYNYSKKLLLMLITLTKKLTVLCLLLLFYLSLIFHDLNFENLTTENFLKEIFFKIVFFLY